MSRHSAACSVKDSGGVCICRIDTLADIREEFAAILTTAAKERRPNSCSTEPPMTR